MVKTRRSFYRNHRGCILLGLLVLGCIVVMGPRPQASILCDKLTNVVEAYFNGDITIGDAVGDVVTVIAGTQNYENAVTFNFDGGNATFDGTGHVIYFDAGAVLVNGVDGINYAPGFGTDVDLITVSVPDSPRLYWDESRDVFTTTKGVTMQIGRLEARKDTDVASADEITLGAGNYFDITGTTTINHINKTNWQAGAVVMLQFDASVTVTHNAGSPAGTEASILLAGAGDFSATADDTLQLIYDGTTFREIGRTVI